MNKTLTLIIGILLGIFLGSNVFTGSNKYLDNSKIIYGDQGFPKNCRAIIKDNVDGFRNKTYTGDEIIDSIDRNCGEFGYSWTK